jgi:hypothetical protein
VKEEHYEGEHLDLAQQMKPWVYFYFPLDGQGAALQERMMRLPQL